MSKQQEEYDKRLSYAIEVVARDPQGQFLLQHIMRMAGLLGVGGSDHGDGRRSVAVELLAVCGACRNGRTITKTILTGIIDEDFEEGDDADENDDLESAILEHS